MSKIICMLLMLAAALCQTVSAQNGQDTAAGSKQLDEVVVTGQYVPQSLRKSVYQVRVINSERIRLRGAANIQQVLNNELGFRFSNDLTLGTTDVQLMGMSGRNVKILLDGVPMVDRGDTRESLSQVDINTVERIEIVEGPMSVNYGSDALAGVINIITRKAGKEKLSVTAKMQEETAGNEYSPFASDGNHIQNVGVTWQCNSWNASAGATHNEFGGWQGISEGREKDWKPKEQFLGHAKLGFRANKFSAWYRLDALDEVIDSKGKMGATYKATDQRYITDRFAHQGQAEWQISDKLQLGTILAYTDYKRKTVTTNIDFATGQRTLTSGAGEQDVSTFNTTVFRSTLQYKMSQRVSFQPGIDINLDRASGARISGSPSINDYAFFVSAEIKPIAGVNIRPGFRFIKNSVYDAPPVIPSVNTKFMLAKNVDLRLAYAHGFRSPALRELYFNFFDASHSIKGNPDLKAEESNSFNGSVMWLVKQQADLRVNSTLGAFYNEFNNLISYGVDPTNPAVFMTVNIDKFKTTGLTWENTAYWKNLQLTAGFSYIGRYNSFSDDPTYSKNNLPQFVWSPEVNSNIAWNIEKAGTRISLFYKYTGKKPSYQTETSGSVTTVNLVNTAAFHMADVTVFKTLTSFLNISGGVKNLFDVTRLDNTAIDTGGAHSNGGAVPMSYGRSYFLGLNFQWSKNK